MFENWEKVLITPMPYRAELAKAILAENEIDAVVLNKQSSSYPPFGNCEVYVPMNHAIIAKLILDMSLTYVPPEE